MMVRRCRTDLLQRGIVVLRMLLASALLVTSGCAATETPDRALPRSTGPIAYSAVQGDDALQLVRQLPAPTHTSGGREQPIAPGDILAFDVFQVDDLARTIEVDALGAVSLPLVGRVQAAGLSVDAFETDLERRYGSEYLQNPDVTILVKESSARRVTIDGEVRRPGVYPVALGTDLSQLIAQAGGFAEVADISKVYVFRDVGEKRLVANVDIAAVRAGRVRDTRIYGGDTVVVFGSAGRIAMQNLKEALGIARNGAVGLAALP